MESEKCSYCGNESKHFSAPDMDGEVRGFCTEHFVKEFEGKELFLRNYLDSLMNDFSKTGEIGERDKKALFEIEKNFPEIAEEFRFLLDEAR
ncbi:MAG: hypothetical protein WDZ77_01600 [Candidatus Pacearchaeota archaeon]